MALLTATNAQGAGEVSITENTLTASDTFTYKSRVDQTLVLVNGTAGALTPLINGDGGTTVSVKGVGSVSVAGGYQLSSIAAGDSVTIRTETISAYCQGTVTVTGGDGMTAYILEY